MTLKWVIALVSAVAGFVLAWQLQAHQIVKLKLEHTNERISQQRAARAATERHQAQIAAAQAASANRGVRNRAAADGAANAGNGLRLATAAAVRTVTADPTSCSDTAAALGAVFDEAVGELQTMAATCDRHVSDIQTLTESWHK
jgi:hypothetical protein